MAKNKKSCKAPIDPMRMLQSYVKGQLLSIEFFKKNFIYIIFAIGMVVMYIGNKYTCQRYTEQVSALKKQVEMANTDWVNAKSKYNSMTRESNMVEIMTSKHLGLTSPEQPPYNLYTK